MSSKLICLISVPTIKAITQLHANVDERLIFPEIDNVQRTYLEPLIGTALFNRLIEGVDLSNLTEDENFLMDSYVNKVLAYYVLSELPEGLSMQFYSSGGVNLSSSNGNSMSVSDLLMMAKNYKNKAEMFAERLVRYLKDNASAAKFPQYLLPGSTVSTVNPIDEDDIGSCSIYLG